MKMEEDTFKAFVISAVTVKIETKCLSGASHVFMWTNNGTRT